MANDKPKRPPFHVEFAEKIVARLKEGTAPWQKPWEDGGQIVVPHNPVSGTVYKGVNMINLALSDFDDPRWMTYKQAQDKGYQVREGSKSTPVLYYQWTKEQDKTDDKGNPVLDEDGKPIRETVILERPIYRQAHVFNAKQIEGMPPLSLTATPHEWEPLEKAESILNASGATIKHDQSNRAFYRRSDDEIHLPPKANFDEPGKYYATALHELGHWTGHSSRLNREGGPYGSELYAREELRAEIASWMVGQSIGVPHDPDQHVAYVASWIKAIEEDPSEIVRACRDAEEIKEYILGLERQKELGEERALTVETSREADAAMGLPETPARPAQEKTWLAVPYKEKEQAKRLGAKWDRSEKSWYAPEGANLDQLARWLPEKHREIVPALPPQAEFGRMLEEAGLDLQGREPIMDGKIHRVPLQDKPGRADGAYCGYMDNHPAGWAQNHVTGEVQHWKATGHILTPEERERQQVERVERMRQAEAARALEHDNAAARAMIVWNSLEEAGEHQYLRDKGVEAFGLRQVQVNDRDELVVPLHNVEGDLRGYQLINRDGSKKFFAGMEKKGNFHTIAAEGKDFSQGEILICEGYATGASLHMATGKPVAVALDSGNLEPVANALREKFPQAQITICADNDHSLKRNGQPWNVGLEKAQRAAQAVGGKMVAPVFDEKEKARGLTDFNDLHRARGLAEVQKQVGLSVQHDKGQTRELSR